MEYKGQFTSTYSVLTKDDKGQWTSKITYTQGRSEDGEHWEEKSTSSTAFGRDSASALAEATYTLMEYLKTVNYGLFESVTPDVKDNSQ